MEYKRPDILDIKRQLSDLLEKFKASRSAEDCKSVYSEIDKIISMVSTMGSIAYIRHTLDTTNEFYASEKDYFDMVDPQFKESVQEILLAALESKHRPKLEKDWGSLMFLNAEISLRTFSPEIIPDLQAENKLVTEYSKLIASAQIEYDGKTLTLAQLAPYHQDDDRQIRKSSLEARAKWFMGYAEELDSIYSKLVEVRTRIARILGYENFVELGYYRMQRNCYSKEMVAAFRESVKKSIVPLALRLKKEQANRIGTDKLSIIDDLYEFPDGNPRPKGSPEEIFAHGRKMYHELSEDTKEFIDFMLENELFDVLTRPGKSSGGYCTSIPDYKSPFIFANFNGTSDDIDVLTHEAGHAFYDYVNRDLFPTNLRECSYETAETHSMSMEFFTWPWMEGFFGNDTAKYRYKHISGALTFIPYGTMVDEFQHYVYENPEITPAQRNELWLKLESEYRPYLDLEGFPFFGEGRRWQAQLHIYEMPFYYIDYVLAQLMALSFWAADQKDHVQAWGNYRRFVGFAGKKTFVDLVEDAGMKNPFKPETLPEVADAALKWLDGSPGL
jgi:M3 family oligoendopeptidase